MRAPGFRHALAACAALAVAATPGAARPQQPSAVDYQFRVSFHGQAPLSDNGHGLAGWFMFPDVTLRDDHARTFTMGGWLWRQDRRWLEVMAGAVVHQDGRVEPLVNLHWNERSLRPLSLSADLKYFGAHRVFCWWLAGQVPVRLGRLNAWVGLETENLTRPGADAFGLGPRIQVPLPFVRGAAIATAFQFRTDRHMVRTYCSFSF